jgi:RHS repeat-associated protein
MSYRRTLPLAFIGMIVSATILLGGTRSTQAAPGTERLPLNTVILATNLTGATVGNLDDDPDAPDALWATMTSLADTALRVGFPTPVAVPVVGADLQEFRVQLRKNATGGTAPTYAVELWEAGVLKQTLISTTSLTSDTPIVVSAKWNASSLTTGSGANVEVRVVGTRVGTGPNRRAVEIGAVEWNSITPVAYGDLVTGSLTVAGEVDTYSFIGASGEKILFRVREVDAAVAPKVTVTRPDGTTLCTVTHPVEVETECAVTTTGVHNVVLESSPAAAGGYQLYLARTSAPPTQTPVAIAYNDVVSGSIDAMKWYPYTFSGVSGERVVLRLGRTGTGNPSLALRLRRPDGTQLCTQTGPGLLGVQFECVLDATGTWTLWASQYGETTLSSLVYVTRTSTPPSETPTPLPYGSVASGTLAPMKWYPYTFTGAVGERIAVRIARTSTSAFGYYDLSLRRPDGSELCSGDGQSHTTMVCVVDSAGTWTLWARSQYAEITSTYSIYVTRLNPSPTEPVTALTYGGVSTAAGAPMKWYPFTFSGTSGERVLLRVVGSDYYPAIALQRPDTSTFTPQSGASFCTSLVANLFDGNVECTLDQTGTWTMWVHYWSFADTTGNVLVHVERLSAPSTNPPTSIDYGHTRTGVLSQMQWYPYRFQGAQNEKVRIRLTAGPGADGAFATLRRPDHSLIGACTTNSYLNMPSDMECTLDVPGTNTYTIWVYGWWGNSTANYALTLTRAPSLGPTYATHPVANPKFPSYDIADPVDLASGNYIYGTTDVSVPSLGGGLTFTRSYNAGIPTARYMGRGWTHNLDMYVTATATTATVYYPDGHGTVFVLQGGSYVAPAGVEDTLQKHVDGTYTLTTKPYAGYFFNAAGKLTGVSDRYGNTSTVAYNASGHLASVTVPGGRQLTFTTDGSGRITQVTDPLGRTVTYTYTGTDLTSVTDIGGGVWNYFYGAFGLTSMTDPLGRTTIVNLFDSAGRVREQVDAAGGRWCFHHGSGSSYTSAGCPAVSPAPTANQVIVVDARGFKTTYEIDFFYRTSKVTRVVDGVTVATTTFYDSENYPSLVRDPLNHDTTFTYDANGNMLTRKNHLNNTWSYTYNALNDVLTASDPLGHTVTNVYTGPRLTSTTDALGNTTSFGVSIEGLLHNVTDPRGNITSHTYDAHGNRTSTTNPLTKVWTSTYDLGGRVLTSTTPLAHTTTNTYNNRNQVLTSTNHLTQTTTFTYDAKGNKKTVTDANAKVTTWNYDNLDRVSSVIDPAAQTTSYVYDAKGNRTSVTNVRGKTTTYIYDALNRRTSVTDPLLRTTSYAYDADSKLTQRTDARGLITKYLYDTADRNTSVEYRTAASVLVSTVGYAYDAANRRTSMTDPTGTTTYAYDNADRVTSVTFPGTPTRTVSYQYDAAGNRTKLTYPDAKFVDYTYDAANRMATVVDRTTATPRTTSYGYDFSGRLVSTAYPNGVTSTQAYDAADRLTTVTNANGGGAFSSFAYTLDGVGNRLSMAATGGGAGTHSYAYDNLYRLTSVTYPGGPTDTYSYDQLGNRLTKNATAYTYDNADGMLTAGGVGYTYDLNGNQLTRGADTFTWDHENRLTQAIVGGVTSSSVYYGSGVRRSHTVAGVTTTYTYDVASSLPLVLQDGTSTLVYGLDLIASTDASGNQIYFSYDGLGSTTDLTNGAGAVTDTYSYDVFGAVRARTGSSSSVWKFTGEQEDGAAGDTSYYFLRARYYDVATGRFVSRDPLELDQRYGYASGNPVLMIDPSGLEDEGSYGPSVEYRTLKIQEECAKHGIICIGAPPTATPTPAPLTEPVVTLAKRGTRNVSDAVRRDPGGAFQCTFDTAMWGVTLSAYFDAMYGPKPSGTAAAFWGGLQVELAPGAVESCVGFAYPTADHGS